nr:hypothetical protein [Tanacetum cinerariifolium]
MIREPGDANHKVTVTETFHVQTDDELSDKELKQIEANDQAIQTILLGLSEDIYADEMFTSNEGKLIESYYHRFLKLMNDLKRNKHFPEKIASNLKFLNNLQPEWSRHVTIVHQTKDLHTTDYTQLYNFLKYNQKEVDGLKAKRLVKTQEPLALMANSNNPHAFPAPHQDQLSFNQNYLQQPIPNPEDITDPTAAMNMGLKLMAKAFKLNYSSPTNNNQRISSNPRNRQIAQPGMNMGQDWQMQMVGGNGINYFRQYVGQNAWNLIGYNDVQNIRNQIGNGNLVAAHAEGNAAGQNGNQIRCYNYRGKEEAGIQLQAEEYDLMAAAADLDKIKEVNANCILMANLQQASTSATQTDNAPVYDLDGSAENDNNGISEDTSVEQGGETVEQQPVNFEATRALYESLYQNLAIEVEKVNSVNHMLKETNADLTTELVRFKNQIRCFEISQEKSDKLERCYQQSVYQEQCLSKKINALHLSTVVSQDIMNIVQKEFVVDTSDLQTKLERTKERFENCIIKKENEYAKRWNDWYKKCDECKYDKISYDKAYKDMQQKIEWLEAQLGDLKGKSKDTSCVSNTRNPLSQKLENENVELEFHVLNYARENARLKATYKNLFDSISMLRTQTKTIIASLENELQSTIYKNDKLRTQLFKKVSNQKDNTHDMSKNTKFAKNQSWDNHPCLMRFMLCQNQSLQTQFQHYKNP